MATQGHPEPFEGPSQSLQGPIPIPQGLCPAPGAVPGYPLLLAGHEGLEARGDAEAQLVNEGRLVLAVDLHLHPHLKRGLICRAGQRVRRKARDLNHFPPEGQGLTCVPPDGQVLLLLHIEHELEAVAGAALQRGQHLAPWPPGVERVALPQACEDLQGHGAHMGHGHGNMAAEIPVPHMSQDRIPVPYRTQDGVPVCPGIGCQCPQEKARTLMVPVPVLPRLCRDIGFRRGSREHVGTLEMGGHKPER